MESQTIVLNEKGLSDFHALCFGPALPGICEANLEGIV